jgi:hypothetical protein
MADDLSGVSAELIETLQRLNSSFRATGDALDESTDTSNQNQRALAAEFEKLGLTLKGETTLLDTHAERVRERIRLEAEVNDQLRNSGKVRQDATDAELEEYKLTQKRNVLYEQELASLGRVINENGKIVKSQVELEGAQKRTIASIKKEEETIKEREQALANFGSMLAELPQKAVLMGLNYAFDTFAAGVTGAYKASIAYEDALLAGTRGMRADAAATAAKMQEMAKVTAKLGSNLSGMGDQFVTVGVGLAFLGGPLGILAGILSVIIGGFFKLKGLEKEQEAAMQERNAELVKKQAEINDKIAAGFTKLGAASIAGADGMSGLHARLNGLTLAVTDLESYSKVLSENKKNLANLGGTMVEGVKSFSSVAGDLIKSSLGKTLENMGIGVEEMMGHTIQFMAYQNRLGIKTTGDVSKATGEYILELDRLAAITGTTRKEQEEAREGILKEQKVQAALMIARENKDEKEIQRIETIINAAALMKSAGAVDESRNFALNQVMKGVITDAGTARAQMMGAGKGGATEMLRNGETDARKVAEAQMRGGARIDKPMAGTVLLGGDNDITSKNLYAQNNFVQSMDKIHKDYEEAKKKDPTIGTITEFLDAQRKVTDGWRQNQVEKERAQRAEQIAKENGILAGQMDTMAKAFQVPANSFMSGAIDFMHAVERFAEAVFKFMKNPIDNTKEFFTGKDKAQRDAEELQEVTKQIEGLKKALSGNAEEVKKTADANLEIAKKEFKARDDYVTELNIQYNKEKGYGKNSEESKKKLAKIEEEQIKAQDASTAARRKMLMAETDVTNAEKAIKASGDPRRKEMMQKQLAGLETKQKELTTSVQSAGPSKTALPGNPGSASYSGAGGASGSGAGKSGGGGYGGGADSSNKGGKSYEFAADNEGGAGAFEQINPKLHDAVIAAADDYFANTGKKLIINSSFRTAERQKKLWEESVKLGHAGTGPKGMTVHDPSKGPSPHEQGRAVDLQNYNDPKAIAALRNAGVYQSEGMKDPVHFQLMRAASGGVFSGPKSGYPVELHGREAVVPLPNFGDKVSVENDQSASKSSLSNVTEESSSGNDFAMMMGDIFAMMENKLDDMIDKLNTSNNYSDKLVKAMV